MDGIMPSDEELRELLIDSIDDRRFNALFPRLLYKDIEWLIDNCVLSIVIRALHEAEIRGRMEGMKQARDRVIRHT